MSLQIEMGAAPQRPNDRAEVVAVFHRYDMALEGVLRDGDSLWFFCCIHGHAENRNTWTYTEISQDELEALEKCNETDYTILRDGLVKKAKLVCVADAPPESVQTLCIIAASAHLREDNHKIWEAGWLARAICDVQFGPIPPGPNGSYI